MKHTTKATSRLATIALLALAPTISLAHPLALPTADPDPSQQHAMDMAFNISDAFEYASAKIEPSVVHITVRKPATRTRRGVSAPSQSGLGSGVIVDERGYIITNNHVIEQGNDIIVRLNDGREMSAELVGTFPESDIAVLKVEASDLTAASFADSEAVRVGQWVLAVGSPFGFEQTVTAGIVSAKGRGSPSSGTNADRSDGLQEFIQTDAAINPGNSGGPLVDLHGRIIGINTAIISRTGSNNGLGFAIPADIAESVTDQLIESGSVRRGWLGISMLPLDPAEAHRLKIDGGVEIRTLIGEGPAKKAKLRAGDIITAVGGRTTENIVRLSNAIMLTKPNDPVDIQYLRDGKLRTASAIVTDRDESMFIAQTGVELEEIGAKLAAGVYRMRNRSIEGFIVTGINRDSPADELGLSPDDFIYGIDGRQFASVESIRDYIRDRQSTEPLNLNFFRNQRNLSAEIQPELDD